MNINLIVKKMFKKWKYNTFNTCSICDYIIINNDLYTTISCKHHFHKYCLQKKLNNHITSQKARFGIRLKCPVCHENLNFDDYFNLQQS